MNGRLTLGENIGDSAGAVAAYYAYRNKKTKLNKPEVRLQGLEEYSDDQIFFMSFAHVSILMKCRDICIRRCDAKQFVNTDNL